LAQGTLEQTLQTAVEHHAAGRLDKAETLYRQILIAHPRDPKTLYRLGLLLLDTQRNQEAIGILDRAAAISPDAWQYHWALGRAHAALQHWDPAVAAYNNAARIKPDSAEVFSLLGIAHHSAGRAEPAIEAYRKTRQLDPNHVENLSNLAAALSAIGQHDEALQCFQKALALRPDSACTLVNYGNTLVQLRRFDEAIAAFRRAAELQPTLPDAWYNMGNALRESGQYAAAIEPYRKAIQLRPTFAEAHMNLGVVLYTLADFKESAQSFLQVITHRPDMVDGYINLGSVMRTMGAVDTAIQSLRQALVLKPDSNAAYCDLANVLKDSGDLDGAIASYRRAVELNPADSISHSNLAYTLLFHPAYDSTAILHEHLRWNSIHAARLNGEIRPHTNDRSPSRKLRIGYLSPDFRDHCQSFFTLALLPHHDRENFEIYCYSHVPRPDAVTQRIEKCADAWRNVCGLSDSELADKIRDDKIDILVDLTMHMAHGRPLVFARKPAPVQVAWLAYPGTTGISAIDYRITDPYLDPPGDSDLAYSEKSLRLPDTFWCYDPLATEPVPNPLPALTAGHITFGCLNNFCKITAPTLDLWGKVMSAVASSRLILLSPPGEHRQRVLAHLAKFSVAGDRIEFREFCPRPIYLRQYHRIDLGLDSIPYNGHTTSLDSFWMGVPVVTRVGNTVVGRAGWSQLCNLGLRELAAQTDEQFIQLAVSLAADLPRLSDLRSTLREKMGQSPLMDAPRFARNMEKAYRQMWQGYCKTD
jgi:predicted O-linked N-acetylglucosamine transferase (SPINDLY family)